MFKKIERMFRRQLHDDLQVVEREILRDVGGKVRRLPGGLAYLPASNITIQIWADGDEDLLDCKKYFVEGRRLESKLRVCLEEDHGLEDAAQPLAEVEIVRGPQPDWDGGKFRIIYSSPDQSSPELSNPEPSLTAPRATLTPLRGQTQRAEYRLDRLALIGRTEEVSGRTGGLTRRNTIVFLDMKDEINASVSQIHSRIEFDPDSRGYRLYDEKSRNGTRVSRGSDIIDVDAVRGIVLRDGDLIYFGQASARFSLSGGFYEIA
ncbi:MAG: FHA domain-containing protein [Blastocatellia bacterium]